MSKKFKRSINYFEITTNNEIKEIHDLLKLSIALDGLLRDAKARMAYQ